MAYVGTVALFEKAGFTKVADTESCSTASPVSSQAARPALSLLRLGRSEPTWAEVIARAEPIDDLSRFVIDDLTVEAVG